MTIIHPVAQAGFGAGTNDLYDRARPSYPTFALDFIHKNVATEGLLKIVEIASGTGIFTRALLADPNWNARIKEIRAVEPSQGMREVFSRTVKDDRITLSDGVFQSTGVQDGWADLVVVAQAFHWCPDYDAASAEFSRILNPQGMVVFIWNLENRDTTKWVGKLRDTIEAYEQTSPQFRRMLWRATFDTVSYKKSFKPPEDKTWDYSLETTKDSVIDRAFSKSYVAVLPQATKTQVKLDLDKILDEGDKVWVNESKGIFEYPYTTWVVISRKT